MCGKKEYVNRTCPREVLLHSSKQQSKTTDLSCASENHRSEKRVHAPNSLRNSNFVISAATTVEGYPEGLLWRVVDGQLLVLAVYLALGRPDRFVLLKYHSVHAR
jgi:hypothetical protein